MAKKKKTYWEAMTSEERTAEMRRRIAKRKRTITSQRKKVARDHGHGRKTEGPAHRASASLEAHVAYLYGRTEVELERYAHSNGLSFAALAAGVAKLLQGGEGRQVVGA
jgi:hypothetical protein